MNIDLVIIKTKDCNEKKITLNIDESRIVRRISGVLQFTSSESFKPSFDMLSVYGCANIDCLIETVEKKMRPDVAEWVKVRLLILRTFVNDHVQIPICLNDYDEGVRRIVVGLLYILRDVITQPIIIDDTLSFILNESYREAFLAMMRPDMFTVNKSLLSNELLYFNPVIIAPGGHGGLYRLARPDKYVVLFDHSRWEIPRREVEQIANS